MSGPPPRGRPSARRAARVPIVRVVRPEREGVGAEASDERGDATDARAPEGQRRFIAEMFKLLGRQVRGELGAEGAIPGGAPHAVHRVAAPPLPQFPRREGQVLDLLVAGKSEKEAANALGISVHTVHVHVKSLHRRLGVNSRAELISRCLRATAPPGGGLGGPTR